MTKIVKKKMGGVRVGAGRPRMDPKGVRKYTTASLPDDLVKILEKKAISEGKKKGQLITEILKNYIEENKLN
jgi:hypothetical protein